MVTWKGPKIRLVTPPLLGPAFQQRREREALLALKLFAALLGDGPLERPDTLHLQEPRQQSALRLPGSARPLAPCRRVWETRRGPEKSNQTVSHQAVEPWRSSERLLFGLLRFKGLRGSKPRVLFLTRPFALPGPRFQLRLRRLVLFPPPSPLRHLG